MEPGLGKQESLTLIELWIRKPVLVIRTMNGDMAADAGCGRAWSVRRVDPRIGDGCRRQVTLQADGVDVG